MGQVVLSIYIDAYNIRIYRIFWMAMASTVRLKATQVTGRPITWAQINLAASEDLRGLMRRNRWAAELVLAFIERMEPGGGVWS